MDSQSPRLTRRQFLAAAAAIGAAPAWASQTVEWSRLAVRERRDLYPEGVASGDPDAHSVLLWTRRPFATGSRARLLVQVAEHQEFRGVVASTEATALAESDWTCRVLVGNLQPSREYWYRFVDEDGAASRVGRTITAPADEDGRAVRFAFVSCQNINLGVLNAYRRMISEDERAPEAERLGFVLHLGDFIYEVVWYPEEYAEGLWGRPIREVVRYPHGEKIGDARIATFYVPTTLDDYRAVYRAYLHDPDLQDARARWPFVCIWDNHEFSAFGWQSVQTFDGRNTPSQKRKVAANQAWFEYQPSRIAKASGLSLDAFEPPEVRDAPIERFDDHGFGDEINNRRATASLTAYRTLRWGRHLELIVTDQRSYRTEPAIERVEARAFVSDDFPQMFPQEAVEILDAGRSYNGGAPPASIRFGDADVPNFRRHEPAQTMLGVDQKRWLLQRLRESRATWKVWGNSRGTLERRTDPQNLPLEIVGRPWPGASYALPPDSDPSSAFVERAEIYGVVRDEGITGFVTVCGDWHAFWAGLAAPSLPPRAFEPVGIVFVTAAISSVGMAEMLEHTLPRTHPLRPLFVAQRTPDGPSEPTMNLLFKHGVRSCLEYVRTGDIEQARRLSNPNLSPHVSFADLATNGYATVRVTGDALECEFVAIPAPLARASSQDGGPVLYRVVHRAPLWKAGARPRLEQRVIEGNPALSL